MTRTLRAVAICIATAVALLLAGAPAWAHAELESSNPAANASLAKAPAEVALTFSEDLAPNQARITVSGPGGTSYETGQPAAAGPTLRMPLRPLGPAGAYLITYRVVSDDGHPVSGTVPFTLTAPGPGAAAAATSAAAAPQSAQPAPTAAQTDDGGTPVWPWIVGAVIVVAAGAALALRRGRA